MGLSFHNFFPEKDIEGGMDGDENEDS